MPKSAANNRKPCLVINGLQIVSGAAGLARYAYEVITRLIYLSPEWDIKVLTTDKYFADRFPGHSYLLPACISPQKGGLGHVLRYIWAKLLLSGLLKRLKADVYYSTSAEVPGGSLNIPCVATIHDLIPVVYKRLYWKQGLLFSRQFKESARKALKIICISRFTEKEYLQRFPQAKKKTEVIYNGVSGLGFSESDNQSAVSKDKILTLLGIEKNFFLFVGALRPYKNIDGAVRALAKIKEQSLDLVIAGPPNPKQKHKLLNLADKLEIKHRVHFLGYVTEEELSALYSRAKALILPSCYEGFGLPALEAMKQGVPVICSNRASLPEVCADAALYVKADDPEDMARVFSRLMQEKKLSSFMIEKGKKRVQEFSWDKTALQIKRLLSEQLCSCKF